MCLWKVVPICLHIKVISYHQQMKYFIVHLKPHIYYQYKGWTTMVPARNPEALHCPPSLTEINGDWFLHTTLCLSKRISGKPLSFHISAVLIKTHDEQLFRMFPAPKTKNLKYSIWFVFYCRHYVFYKNTQTKSEYDVLLDLKPYPYSHNILCFVM